MDEAAITARITGMFENIQVAEADGSWFFFDSEEKKFPFATLVTSDGYDRFSNLERLGVFRLNIGLSRTTFRSLFPVNPEAGDQEERTFDFTELDRLMPHPVYGGMHWVCVLNPTSTTFEKIIPLLVEAHALASGKVF